MRWETTDSGERWPSSRVMWTGCVHPRALRRLTVQRASRIGPPPRRLFCEAGRSSSLFLLTERRSPNVPIFSIQMLTLSYSGSMCIAYAMWANRRTEDAGRLQFALSNCTCLSISRTGAGCRPCSGNLRGRKEANVTVRSLLCWLSFSRASKSMDLLQPYLVSESPQECILALFVRPGPCPSIQT